MKIVVKKFGGTSVGDVPRIKNVARLVFDYTRNNPDKQLVIVVSAMAGETNRLIALSKSCVPEPSSRELDVVMATGEQVTIGLLAMALMELGLKAKSLTGQQACIATDKAHTSARISEIGPDAMLASIKEGCIPVVAGFQGVSDGGDITTLGRGGSDITAVAIAAALNAEACFIYTDVEGVYSADPRVCSKATLLPMVSHEEMLELASLGAKVLHPRSVYFAMRYKVPLVVLSTFKPGDGTWIVEEEKLMEQPVVTGITQKADDCKMTIHKLRGGIGSLSKVFNLLSSAGVVLDMITQTGLVEGTTNISFTVPDENSSQALSLLQGSLSKIGAESVSIERDIAKVSIVGMGMRYHAGVAAKMFEALATEEIEVQMISTSEIKVSVVIPRKYLEVAVRTLHEVFLEAGPGTDA